MNDPTNPFEKRIALIAGQGMLPHMLAQTLTDHQIKHIFVTFDQDVHQDLQKRFSETPLLHARLGTMQPILNFFKAHHINTLIMAGGIRRPRINDLKLDWLGSKWLTQLAPSFLKGDDGLLSDVVRFLKNEGFTIESADTYITHMFLESKTHTLTAPTDQDKADIHQGIQLLNTLSPFDIGQGAIIADQQVLGIEAVEGTQGLLNRIAHWKDQQIKNGTTVPQGILVKMRKINQNQLVDLPTIGPDTIDQAIHAGLKGLAIEAFGVQVLESHRVIQKANDHHLFIHVFKSEKDYQ